MRLVSLLALLSEILMYLLRTVRDALMSFKNEEHPSAFLTQKNSLKKLKAALGPVMVCQAAALLWKLGSCWLLGIASSKCSRLNWLCFGSLANAM